MNTQDTVQVRFLGSPDDIAQWQAELEALPNQVETVSVGQQKDPGALNFGLIETAALVTIITFGFYTLELGSRIYDRLAKAKAQKGAKARVLVVETPLGKAMFTSADNLSKEQITAKLAALVKAHE